MNKKIVMSVVVFILLIAGFALSQFGNSLFFRGDVGGLPSSAFPFVIPWDDAATGAAMDASSLNPAPINESLRVTTHDGHFFTGSKRLRFLGTNLTLSTAFPSHEDADAMAAHMHKYGINMVRLHFMDYYFANAKGIFTDEGRKSLDPIQMEKLDHLINDFKNNGIYVDLNLHVARPATTGDGFSAAEAASAPFMGKIITFFDPKMIAAQKQYAAGLLNYTNASNERLSDNPAIALIEFSNEDTLLGEAWNDFNSLKSGGTLNSFGIELQQQWNAYLKQKYGTMETLNNAWTISEALGTVNKILNPEYSGVRTEWSLESQNGAHAVLTYPGVPGGSVVANIASSTTSAAADVQFMQRGISLSPDTYYTLTFSAATSPSFINSRPLSVYLGLDGPPWSSLGLYQTVKIPGGGAYNDYSMIFRTPDQPRGSDGKLLNGRLLFQIGASNVETRIKNISLVSGAQYSLPLGQTFNDNSIELGHPSDTPAGKDLIQFLMQTEQTYATTMRNYLKNDLGSRALMTCSQASYGELGGVRRESDMDYTDMHSYWDHPADLGVGKISNKAMVSAAFQDSAFAYPSRYRIKGKPFTMSEYDHLFPNDYRAETLPMLATYAAQQDMDGIFLYDYTSYRGEQNLDPTAYSPGSHTLFIYQGVSNYFSTSIDPAKMAYYPLAANIFLRGDVQPLASTATLRLPSDTGALATEEALRGNVMYLAWVAAGMNPSDGLANRMDIDFQSITNPTIARSGTDSGSPQMTWANNLFLVNTPKSQAIVGFPTYQGSGVGPLEFHLDNSSDVGKFVAVSASQSKPGSTLVTVIGSARNNGQPSATDINNITNWGTGPMSVTTAPMRISFDTNGVNAVVYALDAQGSRRTTPLASQFDGRKVSFQVSPSADHAVWYEIDTSLSPLALTAPNGGEGVRSGDTVHLTWTGGNPSWPLRVMAINTATQAVTQLSDNAPNTTQTFDWTVPATLPAGQYSVRVACSYCTDGDAELAQIRHDGNKPVWWDDSDAAFTVAPALLPPLSLTAPNGGEAYRPGDSMNLSWVGGDPTWPISLILINQATQDVVTLTQNVVNTTQTFAWAIPSGTPLGQYTARVYCSNCQEVALPQIRHDGDKPVWWDDSDAAFTVAPALFSPLTLTAPNGGETVRPGDAMHLTWTGGNPAWPVSLLLINQATQSTVSVTQSVSNTNETYDWPVPADLAPGQYTVRAYCAYCSDGLAEFSQIQQNGTKPVWWDDSDAALTVAPPLLSPLNFTSPNAGGSYRSGDTMHMTWTGGNPAWPIALLLINQATQATASVTQSASNTSQTYDWTVPQSLEPGTYTVRAYCAYCSDGLAEFSQIQPNGTKSVWWDDSDAAFTVAPPLFSPLSFSAPNNGGTYHPGDSVNMTWSGGNPAWPVNLLLINQATQDTASVTQGVPNTNQTYNWTVPTDLPAGNYTVRAYCNYCSDGLAEFSQIRQNGSTPVWWDDSDAAFTVILP